MIRMMNFHHCYHYIILISFLSDYIISLNLIAWKKLSGFCATGGV